LLGAVGGPKWSDPNATVRPEQGLLRLRTELGAYANLRPVKVIPQLAQASPLKEALLAGVDMIVVR
jgi:3-isopropylmalate dehydrogenase